MILATFMIYTEILYKEKREEKIYYYYPRGTGKGI